MSLVVNNLQGIERVSWEVKKYNLSGPVDAVFYQKRRTCLSPFIIRCYSASLCEMRSAFTKRQLPDCYLGHAIFVPSPFPKFTPTPSDTQSTKVSPAVSSPGSQKRSVLWLGERIPRSGDPFATWAGSRQGGRVPVDRGGGPKLARDHCLTLFPKKAIWWQWYLCQRGVGGG